MVRQWPPLRNPTEVRSFLGLYGFYQRFVADYATVAAPLTDLLHKSKTWEWGDREQKAMDTLKDRLLRHAVLAIPDPRRPFELYTDASEVGLGATLSQEDDEGHLRLIACRSRKLLQAEKNYPVHEKEMLALVDAVKHWRHYLLGAEVHVNTDSSAMMYLQMSARPSSRQVRWVEELQQYNLKTRHIPGKENAAADALSRIPGDAEMEEIRLTDPRKKRRQVPREQFSPLLIPLVDANDWLNDYLGD